MTCMANFKNFHKSISYCADKSNNSPMPCPSGFTHPSLTLHHHIQPAPVEDYAAAAATTTYNHPRWPVAQKAKAPILNASGSAVTALSAVPMSSTPRQCDDECDTATMNATPQQQLQHHNNECNTATTTATLQQQTRHCNNKCDTTT